MVMLRGLLVGIAVGLLVGLVIAILTLGRGVPQATAEEPAQADFFVEVIRFTLPTPITIDELAIGDVDFEFGNNGPASPVDGSLTFVLDQLDEPEDCAHDQGSTVSLPGLEAPPTQQGRGFAVAIKCFVAGVKTFEVTASVTPLVTSDTNLPVVDPDLSNNVASAIFQVVVVDGDADGDGVLDEADNCPSTANLDQADVDDDGIPGVQPGVGDLFGGDACDPVINVTIDIKPGSDPNSIKLGDRGSVPVAIFSTAKFDATSIDVATLQFNSASVRLVGGRNVLASIEDVNGDGLADLVVKFDRGLLDLEAGDGIGAVTGFTLDTEPILGTDSVRVIE